MHLLRKITSGTIAILLVVVQIVTGLAIHATPIYATTARISSASLDVSELTSAGGEVSLSVDGEGLTADNWDMKISVFIENTDFEAPDKASKVEVVEKSANGATLNVSANGMKNNLDVILRIGVKSDDGEGFIEEPVEVAFTIAKKDYNTQDVTPSSVMLVATNKVEVTFEDEEPEVVDSAYKYVSFTSSDGKGYSLTTEDEVTTADNSIIISLHDDLQNLLGSSNSAYKYVEFKERAIRLASFPANTFNKEFSWILVARPTITKITLDQDVFEFEGGKATAKLDGLQTDQINLSNIDAEVLIAGTNQASGIAIEKDRLSDGTPTLSFTVPENTSPQTESYYLNVKVDGSPVYQGTTENKANLAIVSVVPEGSKTSAATVSAVSITANGGSQPIDSGIETTVSKSIGSLKTELRIFGTGLDDTTTKLRITDENGIEWPVYAIAECDASWRFLAIAGIRGNGIFGNGNTQIIELLPARYAGTNKTFTIEVAPDGKNFDQNSKIKLKINNEGISDEADFVDCTANNFKYITVTYEDEQGNTIAKSDRYQCYEISMPEQYVKAKAIEGYEIVIEPMLDEWVRNGRTYTYVYRKIPETEDPVYNDVPGYQKKDVFETETNTIRGLKVTGTYPDNLEFKIFNTTTQELETTVTANNGVLPNLKLKKNHNYIVSAIERKNQSTYYHSKTYIWNNNGVLKDIKSNYKSNVAEKDWKYNTITSIAVEEVASSQLYKEDRFAARLQVYIGTEGIAANKTFKFISAFDTVEATTKSNGVLTAELLEDVAYTVTIDDPAYGIQSFPLVIKDKSEYGRRRYTYDHSTCHYIGVNPGTGVMDAPIYLVEKTKSHDEDETIVSGTGRTTISGFKFNDLIAKENKLDAKVDALTDNTYDVISVKVINPHRWEVSKICAGEFTISEKYDVSRDVKNVYLLKDDGSIEKVDYEIKNGSVVFTTSSLSLYPVVIEYNNQAEPEDTTGIVDRIDGASRYDTALNAANQYMAVSGKKSLESIIVTNGEKFPDALAGGYLAKVKDAPIIIVNSKNEKKIEDYIYDNVNVGGRVYILGGENAVSKKFENAITADFDIKRLGGATRYDTNIEILKEAGVKSEELLVCTGGNFADSLSASAAGRPIFIVGKELTTSQKEYLNTITPDKLYAIGGTNAVSDAVLKTVEELTNQTAKRISGSTRYETSVNVAKELVSSNPETVMVTTGKNFPDGLAGGPLANKIGAPLILVNSEKDNVYAEEYCRNARVERAIALGGTAVVSEQVRTSLIFK